MTPEQHRQVAHDVLVDRCQMGTDDSEIEARIHASLDYSSADLAAIAKLVNTSHVEITWPDEVPEWERALLERQAAADTARDLEIRDLIERVRRIAPITAEPAGLTPAQEIRLRAFESLTNERTETDEIRDVLAMVVQAGRIIETGELDDLEEPNPYSAAEIGKALAQDRLDRVAEVLDAVGASLPASDAAQLRAALEWVPEEPATHVPGTPFKVGERVTYASMSDDAWAAHSRVGYSQTLHMPGTDTVLVGKGAGFEPVTTVADPGGLLNDSWPAPCGYVRTIWDDEEFPIYDQCLAPSGHDGDHGPWWTPSPKPPSEATEPVKQTADPHSDTQTGSTALTGGLAAPATAIPAQGEDAP